MAADRRDAAAAPVPARRPHFGVWALLYAAAVFYASVVVTQGVMEFTWHDPEQVFWKLVNVPLVANGSDQRADWMGNLGMLLPLGFLTAAMLLPAPRPRGRTWGRQGALYGGVSRRVFAAIAALPVCFVFIVGVKYAQLFTPRTVTLNYIIAQTTGACLGILWCVVGIDAMTVAVRRIRDGSYQGLLALLRFYTLAVVFFVAAPFDVVLSAGDVADRLASLPNSLFAIPGADRPAHLRLLIVAGGAAMMMPVGMLLQATRPGQSLAGVAARGLVLAVGMLGLSMAILGASPTLVSVPLRMAGIIGGAVVYRILGRINLALWRRVLPWLAALGVLPYLGALLVANSLVSLRWRMPSDVLATFDPRFLLPFWTHYMVPKAQAIKSVVVHALMYLPVGAAVWAWFGGGAWQTRLAFVLAFVLGVVMEIGRLFTPGLMLDLNNALIGAIAAAGMVGLSRILWAMLESIRATRLAAEGSDRDG